MPVIKSAIKKLRQDKKRTQFNDTVRKQLDIAVTRAKKETKDFGVISKAYSVVDKAAKQGILPKNKAARIKASLAKNVKPAKLSSSVATKPKTSKKSLAKA